MSGTGYRYCGFPRGAVAAGLALLASALMGAASAETLPQQGSDVHLGVASCSGSTCHGAMEPWKGSNVLQNEYITWLKRDKHAKAYEVLFNDRAKRIAANLGLKAPNTEPVCLECHADFVPEAQRSKQFQMSDGVGCEACHGGSARWLGIHVSGRGTHQDNINTGMYPTDQPVARAALCLSCHFGGERKFVTHRMMGAGHPRLAFLELDTFTAIQPAHFVANAKYRERKRAANGVQVWAVGQAMALEKELDALADPKRNADGVFPELVLFDCFACHHSLNDLRWQPRASTGLPAGVPRINDANFGMLRLIAQRISPGMEKELSERGRALHQAALRSREAMAEAAKSMRETVRKLVPLLDQHGFGRDDVRALLVAVVDGGHGGDYLDYAAAEQATMALSAIVNAMKDTGMVDATQYQALNAALNKCYDAVNKQDVYKAPAFLSALADFKRAIPSG